MSYPFIVQVSKVSIYEIDVTLFYQQILSTNKPNTNPNPNTYPNPNPKRRKSEG